MDSDRDNARHVWNRGTGLQGRIELWVHLPTRKLWEQTNQVLQLRPSSQV